MPAQLSRLRRPWLFRLGIGGRLIALHLVVLLTLTLLLGGIEVVFLQRNVQDELGARALSISRLVATIPLVMQAAELGQQDAAMNAYVNRLSARVGADYIVVGDVRGIRLAHPVADRLGKPMEGGDNAQPLAGHELVNTATGSLGLSVRCKVPIRSASGRVVGVVSTGYLMPRVRSLALRVARAILPWFLLTLALGTLGALLIARLLKRQILNLEPEQIAALVGQHRAVLAALREGVIAVDASGNVTLANENAARLLGQELSSTVQTRRLLLSELWPELAAVRHDHPLRNLGLQRRGLPVIVNVEPLQGGGFVASFRDRAEVVRLAEELTQVRGFVDVLRAQTHEHLNRMHTISGLLQLGRPDEAIKVVREEVRRDTDLRELLRGIQVPRLAALLTGKRDRAAELGLNFMVEPGSELSARWETAGEALLTAAGNLIENAFEALRGASGGTVILSVGEDPEGMQLEVTDDGPGVPSAIVPLLFERGTSSRGQGRGYGLTNVTTRVTALGGSVRYLRRGPLTVFQISLPSSAAGAVPLPAVLPLPRQERR